MQVAVNTTYMDVGSADIAGANICHHVRSTATSMLQKPDKATTCIAGSDTTLNSYTYLT